MIFIIHALNENNLVMNNDYIKKCMDKALQIFGRMALVKTK